MTPDEFDEAAAYWTRKENDAARMPEADLHEAIDEFLTSHNTCALACAADDFVRCTPLEYTYRDNAIWIFSEGGLKFAALKKNLNVSVAVFEPYAGFGKLESAQITGTAHIVNPESNEFARMAAAKGIKGDAFARVRSMLHLIKITPSHIDYLSSDLKAKGFDSRQWVDLRNSAE